MTAIIAGQGLGLLNTSNGLLGGSLGQVGQASQGRGSEQVYVNASTGNLVVQQQDEWLVGLGPDATVSRTYNSAGTGNDDNGDNWRLGLSRRIYGITGTVNQNGSSIKRIGEDGAETVYSFDVTRGVYVSWDGGGAFDTLTYTAANQRWTWTDGDTQTVEVYTTVSGYDARLSTVTDPDGNKITLSYNASTYLITNIATTARDAGAQESIAITYDTAAGKTSNILSMSTTYYELGNVKTVKRVEYTYDSANRLSTVKVDLTLADTADTSSYTTTYTYDGTSKRIATLTQTDGSRLEFAYDTGGRVIEVRESAILAYLGTTQMLVTTLDYSTVGVTKVKNPAGLITELTYNTAGGQNFGQLVKIKEPVIAGVARETVFTYDGSGNVTSVKDARGNTTVYRYDAQGNRIYERDAQGATTERLYGGTNLLVQETTYTVADSDGDGALLPSGASTTRYVYDAKGHLRFQISAEGRVTQYTYNALGQLTSTDQYTDATFDVATLTTWAQDFSVNSNGLSPLSGQFALSGGTVRVSSVNQATQAWPSVSGSAQPMGSVWRMEITTPTVISNGLLDVGIDSGGWGGADYRRHRLAVSNNTFYADVYIGASALPWVPMGTVKPSTNYVLELVTTPDGGSTLYVYEKGKERSSGMSDSRNLGGWGSPTLQIQTYAGSDTANSTIVLDNMSIQQPLESVLSTWASSRNLTQSQRTTYTYNSRGQLDKSEVYSSITAAGVASAPISTQYVYDQAGNLLTKIDGSYHQTIYSYDGLNRITSTTDGVGNVTTTQQIDWLRGTMETRANGLSTIRVYDPKGLLLAEQQSSSVSDFGITYYQYDTLGRLVSSTNPANERTFYLYDNASRLVGQVDALGALTQYTYNANDQIIQTRKWANKVSAGVLAALAADPASGTLTASLLGNDLSGWSRGVDGSATNFQNGTNLSSWRLQGESTAWLKQAGTEAISSFLSSGDLTVAAGSTYEVSAYTGAHRATASLEVVFYDANNVKVGATAVPTGGVTTNASEKAGGEQLSGYKRLWGFVTAPAGAVKARVQVRKAPTTAGQADSYLFVTHAYFGAAATGQTQPTALDIRPAASAEDRIDVNIYDKAGQLVKTIDAVGAVVQYKYDATGQLLSTTQFNSKLSAAKLLAVQTTSTELLPTDTNTQPTVSGLYDRTERSYYSADGQLLGQVDGENYYTAYFYDAAGNLSRTVKYAQPVAGVLSDSSPQPTVYATAPGSGSGYVITTPADDQSTYYFYNTRGLKVGVVDAEGYYTVYSYTGSGQVAQERRYANKVLGSFDGSVRPSLISSTATAPSTGPYLRTDDTNDRKTYNFYDGNDRLLTQFVMPDGTATGYAYDAAGNVTGVSKQVNDNALQVKTSRYDARGLLTGTLSAVGQDLLYTWIAANPEATPEALELKTIEIWGTYGTQYIYDQVGRMVASVSPDGVGQSGLKTFYYYDAAGRLTYSVNALGEVTQYAYNTFGELTTQIQVGQRLDQATIDDQTGGNETLVSSAVSTLIASNTNNSTKKWAYDIRGLVNKTTDELNNDNTYTYNAFGEQLATTERIDATRTLTTMYGYDRRGLKFYALEGVSRYTLDVSYDAFGRVIAQYDQNGDLSAQASYDRLGRKISTYDGHGSRTSTTYDSFDRTVTVTDAQGKVSTITYDPNTRSKTITTAESISTTLVTDAVGQVISVTDGRGSQTSYTYDLDGRLTGTSLTAAGTSTELNSTSTSYDTAGRVHETVDERGTVTRTEYDAASRVLSRTVDPTGLNIKTSFRYDAKGQAIWSQDALGVWTRTDYDAKGQVTAVVIDPQRSPNWVSGVDDNLYGLNQRTEYTYDAKGHQLSVIRAAGTSSAQKTSYEFDVLGRRVKEIVDPAGLNLITTYTYDNNDNVVAKTDALGHVTRYTYDINNRQVYSVDATGAVTYTEYDQLGQVTQQTAYATRINLTGLNLAATTLEVTLRVVYNSTTDQITRHVYDADGRRIYSIDALGYVTQRTFDAVGNVVRETRYAKAATGGLATQNLLNGHFSLSAPTVVTDAQDRTTQTVYDAAGRAIWVIDAQGYATANTYDAAGNVVQTTQYANKLQFVTASQTLLGINQVPLIGSSTTAGAAYVVADAARDRSTYTVYNRANQATHIIDAQGYLTRKNYNSAGKQTLQIRYANTVGGTYQQGVAPAVISSTATAPTTGSYIRQAAAGAAERDERTQYYYDLAGRLVEVLDAEGHTISYAYDAAGNVISEIADSYGSDWSEKAYTYDAAGRLTSVTLASGTDQAATTTYTLDALGQRFATTDPEGNVTFQDFDAVGRVTVSTDALSKQTLTTYDAFGNKVKVTDPRGNSIHTYYDKANKAVWAVNAGGYAVQNSYDAYGQLTQSTLYAKAVTGTAAVGTAPRAFATQSEATASGATLYVLSDSTKDIVSKNEYDKLGHVTRQTDAENYSILSTYDGFGNKLTDTNEVGGIRTYTYDRLGRKLTEKAPEQVKKLDANGNIVTSGGSAVMVDAVTRYTYDAHGNVTRKVEAENLAEQRITDYRYDRLNRLIEETAESTSTYTVLGGVQTVTPKKTTVYDGRGNIIEVKDANGNRTLTYWDEGNRRTASISAAGTLTTWTYTDNGLVESERIYATLVPLPATAGGTPPAAPADAEANIRVKLYTYDANNRQIKVTTPGVAIGDVNPATGGFEMLTVDVIVTQAYDAAGNVVRTTDARGNSSYTYYDKVGNRIGTIDAERYLTVYSFDGAGRITGETRYAKSIPYTTRVDASTDIVAVAATLGTTDNRKTDYVLDRLGQIKQKIVRSVASATVNATTGALTEQVVDAITEYTYNGLGLVTQRKEATGEYLNWAFDKQGRETSALGAVFTDYSGVTTARANQDTEYNALGSISRQIQRGLTAGVETDDHITRYVYGKNGWLASKTDATGAVSNFAYDSAGNLTRQWLERNDADGLAAKDDANAKGKLWLDRGVATTSEGEWVDLNGRTAVTAATGLVFTGEVQLGTNMLGRQVLLGIENSRAGLSEVPASYRRLDAYFKDSALWVSYRDANGAWKEEAVSPAVTLVAGKTYVVTVKIQADRARLEVADKAAPTVVLGSKEVLYKSGNTPATEWGTVRVHVATNQKPGVVANGAYPRDAVDNLKIVNSSAATLFSEDFTNISTQFEYVNNANKAIWQVDSLGRSGRISTDYTDYVIDAAGHDVQHKSYSNYVGNVDDQGKAIVYGSSSTEALYNAFGEIATKGTNSGFQEEVSYNKMGWLMTSTAGDGVMKFHYYDANGNMTLKVTPSSNKNDDGTNKTSNQLYVYDKNNRLTDTYVKRVDDPQFTAAGVWVADGGPITQGSLSHVSGEITTLYGTSTRNVIAGPYYVDYYPLYLSTPNFSAYENGDLRLTAVFYDASGNQVYTRTFTYRPEEPLSFATMASANIAVLPGSNSDLYLYADDSGTGQWAYSMKVTVATNTKYGPVTLGTVDYPKGPGQANLAYSRKATLPNVLNIKSQPLKTTKLVFMYREQGTNDTWKFKTTTQMQIGGKAIDGWFNMSDWSGVVADDRKYEFRYVALDAQGSVLNSQEGWISLNGTTLSGKQEGRAILGAGRAFMDSAGNINVTEQGATAIRARVKVRLRTPSATWQTLSTLSSATVLGSAVNGWFQFNPASLGLAAGTYDYVVETFSDTGLTANVGKVVGSFTKGDSNSATNDLVKYVDIPQMIQLGNQPLTAARGQVLYRLAGTTGNFTITPLSKVGPGKFAWDAYNLSLGLASDTDYEVQFQVFDAAGRLLSTNAGAVTLGQTNEATIYASAMDPHLFYLRPPMTQAYAAGSYLKVFVRMDSLQAFQPYPDPLALQPSGMFTLYASATDLPENGFVDAQYYYEVYDVNNNKITTVNMDGATLADIPTAANPASFRYQPIGRPTPTAVYPGWSDATMAAHSSQKYNAFGEVVEESDAFGHLTKLTYNTQGKLTLKTDPETDIVGENGAKTRGTPTTYYYYDLQGRLVGTKDANTYKTTYVLKGEGNGETRIVREFHPDGGNKLNAYDVFDNLRTATDEIGGVTTYEYDNENRQTRVNHALRQDPSGATTAYNNKRGYDLYVYDAAGNRIKHQTTPDGTQVLEDRTYFDAAGRVIKSVSAAGRATVTRYEDGVAVTGLGSQAVVGSRKTVTDANGRSLIDESDSFGHVTKHTDLGGHVFVYEYDEVGGLSYEYSYDFGVTGGNNGGAQTGQMIGYTYYDDGRVKTIHDYSLNTYTVYSYDIAGNKTFEGYATVDGSNFYQKAVIKYDELNRMKSIEDPQYSITYEYDAVGNRRHLTATSAGGAAPSDFWYRYDAMNRFVVSMGQLSGTAGASGTSIVAGTTGSGVAISYDLAGNRKQADYASDGHSEQYDYTAEGYLTKTRIKAKTDAAYHDAALRTSDLMGRVMTYIEYGTNTTTHNYVYDNDSLVKTDQLLTNGSVTTTTTYTFLKDGTVDKVTDAGTTTNETNYEYEWWDKAQVRKLKGPASTWKDGTSEYIYDVNGNVAEAIEHGTTTTTNKLRALRYITNAQGLVLFRDEVLQGAADSTRQTYFYVDGQRVGETGNDATAGKATIDYAAVLAVGSGGGGRDYKKVHDTQSSNFDQNYQAINNSYPGFTSSGYTVRSDKETLETIARSVWGDGAMWYLIAEANGMSNSTKLKVGQVLEIPNKVANVHNGSGRSSQVYTPGAAMGDTRPSGPQKLADKPTAPQVSTPQDRQKEAWKRLFGMAVSAVVTPMASGVRIAANQQDELLKKLRQQDGVDSSASIDELGSERETAQFYDSFSSFGGGYSSFGGGYDSWGSSSWNSWGSSSYSYNSWDSWGTSSLSSLSSLSSWNVPSYNAWDSWGTSSLSSLSSFSSWDSWATPSYSSWDSWGTSSFSSLSSSSWDSWATPSYNSWDSWGTSSFSSLSSSSWDSWTTPSYSSWDSWGTSSLGSSSLSSSWNSWDSWSTPSYSSWDSWGSTSSFSSSLSSSWNSWDSWASPSYNTWDNWSTSSLSSLSSWNSWDSWSTPSYNNSFSSLSNSSWSSWDSWNTPSYNTWDSWNSPSYSFDSFSGGLDSFNSGLDLWGSSSLLGNPWNSYDPWGSSLLGGGGSSLLGGGSSFNDVSNTPTWSNDLFGSSLSNYGGGLNFGASNLLGGNTSFSNYGDSLLGFTSDSLYGGYSGFDSGSFLGNTAYGSSFSQDGNWGLGSAGSSLMNWAENSRSSGLFSLTGSYDSWQRSSYMDKIHTKADGAVGAIDDIASRTLDRRFNWADYDLDSAEMKQVRALAQDASTYRDVTRTATQNSLSPWGKYVSQKIEGGSVTFDERLTSKTTSLNRTLSDVGRTASEFEVLRGVAQGAGKSNAWVSGLSTTAKWLGPVASTAQLGMAGYQIYDAAPQDRMKVSITEGFGLLTGLGAGAVGTVATAAIIAALSLPLAVAAPALIIGTLLVGGAAGYFGGEAGRWGGQKVANYLGY